MTYAAGPSLTPLKLIQLSMPLDILYWDIFIHLCSHRFRPCRHKVVEPRHDPFLCEFHVPITIYFRERNGQNFVVLLIS